MRPTSANFASTREGSFGSAATGRGGGSASAAAPPTTEPAVTADALLASLKDFASKENTSSGGFKLDLSGLGTAKLQQQQQPSPMIPKIPNFARALSGSSGAASGGSSGSLSARELPSSSSQKREDPEAWRRPLTARPAESLGVTTPRGTPMSGPRPGDRSMRGMDGLLAMYRDQPLTPRSLSGRSPASAAAAASASGGGGRALDDGPMTPRSPRSSPRGAGIVSARKRGDEVIRAPPPLRSPRGGSAGNKKHGAMPPPLRSIPSYGSSSTAPPPPAPPTTPVRGVNKEAIRDVMARVERLSQVVKSLALDGGV